jgi:hypothetical protein
MDTRTAKKLKNIFILIFIAGAIFMYMLVSNSIN